MADLTGDQKRAVTTLALEAYGHCSYRGEGFDDIDAALTELGMTMDDVYEALRSGAFE